MNEKHQKKNHTCLSVRRPFICFFLALGVFLLSAFPTELYAQKKTITLDYKELGLMELFKKIEEKSDYVFFYYDVLIDKDVKVPARFKNMTVEQILDKVFANMELAYSINKKQITIKKKVLQEKTKKEGQSSIVKGVVFDQSREPLPGVSIVVQGTNIGTVSDLNGAYSIHVPSDDSKIIFSYIGFAPVTYSAKEMNKLSEVVLVEDTKTIDEVVVVGYTTRTREKLISSVSTINNQELVKSTVPNLENALTGRVSGVFSRQTSAEPGSDGADLKIRGFGSALVVVDGIPGRNYSDIDPSEIESVSVLKDASAAAVYGMQGANGVILVTTKRGGKNKPTTLDINTRFGLQMPHNYPQPASTPLWQTLVGEYYANMKLINDKNAVITPADMATRDYAYNTNWYEEMIKNAPITQSNINISGGTDKVSYFISAGYLYQGGIWSTNSTDKNRFNFRSNLDADILKNLKLSVGVGAVINSLNYPRSASYEIARKMKDMAPNIPVKWPGHDDYYAFGGEGTVNPMALADKEASGYSKKIAKNLNVDFSLEYKVPFVEGLSLKATMGYTQSDSWNKNWNMNIVYMGYREDAQEYYESASASNANKASLSLEDGFSYNITGQGFINYIRSFGNHNINSGLVFEFSDAENRSTVTSRGEFPSTVLDMMAGGIANKQVTNSEVFRKYRTASFIGRFSYDYRSKYFVDFNFRYDGAQYFADKWGFFPSASVGWMLTNEEFMNPLKKVLNEFKIRASWGELGDLSAASQYYANNEQYYFQSGYQYPGTPMNFGDRTIYGLNPTLNPNPDFTWATSSMINAGVDFKLWNGLLSGSADVFYRQRKGLPAQKANDNAGALATWYNLDHDNTRGFEFSLNHQYKIGEVNYFVGGNMSWSRTRKGNIEHGRFTSGYDEWKWNTEGHWNNVRWGYNCIGRYQSYGEIANAPMHNNSNNNSAILPGDLKYEDWNGDGYIDNFDQRPIGRNAYPELVYGINLGLSWKGVDFSMFWQGGALSDFQIGAFDMDAFQEGATNLNTWEYFGDRWHRADYTDPNSEWIPGYFPAVRDFTSVTINRLSSNFWMWNGSYIRLKNVELGYTLPQRITQKANIKQLRIYANLYNCLTFSSQKFFDPEQLESQYSFASYPQIMSFNVGINLKF